jgi:hypothetical protein
MLFRRLRQEDQLISAEDLHSLPEAELDRICFDRGINIDQTQREQIEDLRLWLSISNLRNVPHSLLLIARINDFASESFAIDEDETADEILRRVRRRLE